MITFSSNNNKYTLINYEEIISYYKLPWYKKMFKTAPVKKLKRLIK